MIELSKSQEERALILHKEAIVIDAHCDSIGYPYIKKMGSPLPLSSNEQGETGFVGLPLLLEGGVTCQVFATGIFSAPIAPEAALKGLKQVDQFQNGMGKTPGFKTVTTVEEILQAKKDGIVTGILGMEGAEPLMGDLALLRIYYMLGLRMLSFTWDFRTPFADGLGAKRAAGKLPELGVQALEEMEKLGIVLDVSHICDTNYYDICDLMDGPFIASHSNCRALCDVSRNLTDDMIHALADHGGVMGMTYGKFVDKENPSIKKRVDHIDHIVDLVGPDHVGIGSGAPERARDASMVPNMTRELVRREYNDDDVKKILGGNFLRVFKTVFK